MSENYFTAEANARHEIGLVMNDSALMPTGVEVEDEKRARERARRRLSVIVKYGVAQTFLEPLLQEKATLEEKLEAVQQEIEVLQSVESGTSYAIPKDATYPASAVQCNDCGGNGCATCEGKGWLPYGHTDGRLCDYEGCKQPLIPSWLSTYCSNACARADR